MDQRLAINGGDPSCQDPVSFAWPILTHDMEEGLLAQARTALSVYDGGGVVQRFEDNLSTYLGIAHVLATSSGTAALFSLYYSLGISKDDEVILSDYGFFATATPLLLLGITPVFVDCDPDGNISVEEVVRAVTRRTRAVVVTHMWGAPARVSELAQLCSDLGLMLIEDSSHAHGARSNGILVGTFGDGSAWSLQAGKTLWAGEGGFLATRHDNLFERALLVGHFNKRAMRDIPSDSVNATYAFTGTGLKLRPHPLGLALALQQLPGLDELVGGRQMVAASWIESLANCPGIRVLSMSGPNYLHSYYGLVVLIDASRAGLTPTNFIRALEAENVRCVSRPTQMGQVSKFPVFTAAGARRVGESPNACRIEHDAVCFFVPSLASPGVRAADIDAVALAIRKVRSAFRPV
jgi:perosamine synthetase